MAEDNGGRRVAFGWSAAAASRPPKRPRVESAAAVLAADEDGPLVGDLRIAFRNQQDLEDEVTEEAPAPSRMLMQLEDAEAKRGRLCREATLLAECGRFAEALPRWEEALQYCGKGRDEAQIHEQMAQALLEMGRDFDAARLAARAVECDTDWHCGHLTLGRALLCLADPLAAVEALRRAAQLAPGDADVRDELSSAEAVLAEVEERAASDRSLAVAVNGRVLVPRFWETALRVTYDVQGQGTTHYSGPPEVGGPTRGDPAGEDVG